MASLSPYGSRPSLPILAWARSPVAPVGGALSSLSIHELAAPVLLGLLAQIGLKPDAVDTVVLGNAMGAGGNPARMLALAAGLPDSCAAHSVDTQCCSGLDAIALAAGLLQSGQAEVVIAGGAEAWSRAPIRQTRPRHAGESPQSYDRPAFAPDTARDPDMLQSAADYALSQGFSRSAQEDYALQSHARALQAQAWLSREIIPVAGLAHDTYPRLVRAERAARMPIVAQASHDQRRPADQDPRDYALSALTIAAKADGAALVLMATHQACKRLKLTPHAHWLASASVGGAPETPLLSAAAATRKLLERTALSIGNISAIELHDAFAVQALAFRQELGLPLSRLNPMGSGLARGHPIAASGAIALVRTLTQLQQTPKQAWSSRPPLGLAAIAGAGGIGAACLVQAAAAANSQINS